jgi:hypothetical protein
MCKEMPVILVNRVVDKKRLIGKMVGQGGEVQGVADAPPPKKKSLLRQGIWKQRTYIRSNLSGLLCLLITMDRWILLSKASMPELYSKTPRESR